MMTRYLASNGSRAAIAAFLSVALALALGPPATAHAGGFNVTKTADTADGICDADCSLREAIVAANASPGPDSITLPAGTYTLSLGGAGENAGVTGDLDITGDLALAPADGTAVIDAGQLDRALEVLAGATVTLERITVTNGDAAETGFGGGIANHGALTLTDVRVENSRVGSYHGGGIGNNGTLTLNNVTVIGNYADYSGGGIYNTGTLTLNGSSVVANSAYEDSTGGGIHNDGTLVVLDSTISENRSSRYGGGIYNTNSLLVERSTVGDNQIRTSSGAYGGGIANTGTMRVVASSLGGNHATTNDNDAYGGAIWNDGAATLEQTSMDRNVAEDDTSAGRGGAVANTGQLSITGGSISGNIATSGDFSEARGGGIYNTGVLTLTALVLADNHASSPHAAYGGAIDNKGNLTANNVTITRNTAEPFHSASATTTGGGVFNQSGATFSARNTIVAGNADGGRSAPDFAGRLTSRGYNLLQHTAGSSISGDTTGNLLSLDAELGFYNEPLPGSPAVDAGTNSGCANTPQDGNGNGRAACDIGAIELAADPPPISNLLANGGMEQDTNGDAAPDGWTVKPWVRLSGAGPHSGSYAMRHQATNNDSYTIVQRVPGLAPDATYQAHAWVNIPSTSDTFSFRLELRWLNASGGTISTATIKSYSAATGGWKLSSASMAAPAGTASGELRMAVSSLKATVDVDDLALQTLNLMANPGFELDANGDGKPDSWSTSSYVARSTASAHSGSYALRHRSTGNASYAIWQTVGVAGSVFRASGWVSIPATTDSFTFRVLINWRDAANTIIRSDELASYGQATPGWVQLARRLQAPQGAVSATLRQEVGGLNATVYVDDLVLQPVNGDYAVATGAAVLTLVPDEALAEEPAAETLPDAAAP